MYTKSTPCPLKSQPMIQITRISLRLFPVLVVVSVVVFVMV